MLFFGCSSHLIEWRAHVVASVVMTKVIEIISCARQFCTHL